MTPEPESNLRLEIGHVLFLDLVGYSKLLIEEQKARLSKLTEVVLATTQVAEVTDVSGRTNITGGGINMAQRVMDCGDAGHILLSKHVANDLQEHRQWSSWLHDLGECEVKHGVRLGIVNLYHDGAGNPQLPSNLRVSRQKQNRKQWAAIAA